ncbi:innexin unc-9-like [Lingula anatina]|uniref:Innexin n=1 Tax=Lingula anatina TaxID=7574 RepID=A0A2R2MS03_LINAN|nr:innexin unc-9-like [Lingula anatina]|eukprot:XP_023933040.1 innexin unc-9-like [Lingula anatina]
MLPFEEIVDGIHRFWKKNRRAYDSYDRVNHRYTAMILMLSAALVLIVTYIVSDPVSCWVPATFTHEHAVYANRYCWVKNTYFLPFEERIPSAELPRAHIGYYQWVPHILLFQAVLFCIPGYLWRFLSKTTGIDIHMIAQTLNTQECLDPLKRNAVIKPIALHLAGCFSSRKRRTNSTCLMTPSEYHLESCDSTETESFSRQRIQSTEKPNKCQACMVQHGLCLGKKHGTYLVPIFFLCKMLFLGNSVGQLFLLNYFLGTTYSVYGFNVISDLIDGKDWSETGRFPRVTLCDFKIRQLGGNIHRHTVQCVLYANLLNENLFIFIWFWLVFVSFVNVFGILLSLSVVFPRERLRFITRKLKFSKKIDVTDKRDLSTFVHKYLSLDGVFVLMLIGRNSNDVVISELIAEMWEHYREECN